MELHQELAKCYTNLGNNGKADEHRKLYKDLNQQREKSWTRFDMENEGLINTLAAIQYALQQAHFGPTPEGWMQQFWERVLMEKGSKNDAAHQEAKDRA